ncbi:FadR family transcriptional regulator [Chitinophaga alhagiae]|uniref:FadR family transcriptional regulator n=1 Tax=Chitinophaga alhagiae TaxID=2203219 RepID=A0ABM6WDR7_9BACT|nr:FadR/GntR family transcriptional regulator [Chitinophaga alhagiae]AWO02235.1 FadR family transcriptional regulator [Chitinophaga alhagiae]
MMTNYQPLQRRNLADEVAAQLRQLISTGVYTVGQRLPTEPELMQQFGVGRSTIREAVRQMVNAGLVRVQQGLGTFVISQQALAEPLAQRFNRAHFQDLNEVRLLLEVKIAEKAAMHRTKEDIARMKAFLKKRYDAARANDVEACRRADVDFHTAIAMASGNEIMVDLYKTIATHLIQSFKDRFTDTVTFLETQHLHKALLESIIDKDSAQALVWASRISSSVK